MTMDHIYHPELTANDPMASQPPAIKIPMKPHQLAGLAKAIAMERTGHLRFTDVKIGSNLGILGDIVGYGKTLTALGIIAATPTKDIAINTTKTSTAYTNHAHATIERECTPDVSQTIPSTLIVVPKGPVYIQWRDALKSHTNLNHLDLDGSITISRRLPRPDSTINEIKAAMSAYQVVLVKDTMVKKMLDHFTADDSPYTRDTNPFLHWDRIMVDESHNIIWNIPNMSFKFMWLISSTYYCMYCRRVNSSSLGWHVRCVNEELQEGLVIRGEKGFVMSSFSVPPAVEHWYNCKLPHNITHIMTFLTKKVQDLINAADYRGAIEEMGGNIETETDIAKVLTQDVERDMANKEKEIQLVNALDIPEANRTERLKSLTTALERLKERHGGIMERVTQLSAKSCPICYEVYKDPIMMECTHVFCGACIMDWLKTSKQSICPQCRSSVSSSSMVAIVGEQSTKVGSGAGASTSTVMEPEAKEDTLLRLIKLKPNGKFLVFSCHDASFWMLQKMLDEHNISFTEMKGTTATMMHNLERFKAGQTKVILLNAHFAGSGIDISCATDVVIFHSMGASKIQSVGRAQRVGRTSTLTIHNLCYPHELPHGQAVSTVQ